MLFRWSDSPRGTWLHHGLAVPDDPHIRSHDFLGLQWARVTSFLSGERTPAREGLENLSLWAGNPLAFFGPAYGATTPPAWGPWRLAGWLFVAVGAALGWRGRHPTPQDALLRFLSVYAPLQVGFLWLGARDLHHLAQAAAALAILAGLALERLVATVSPPRSIPRARDALLVSLPWLATGITATLRTPAVLDTIETPTFSAPRQAALVAFLRAHDVERVVACDYELTGLVEVLAPEIAVVHGWGAASREGTAALPGVIEAAVGGHLLLVEASAPMIYNLAPSTARLREVASGEGLVVTPVADAPGLRLFAVSRQYYDSTSP